MRRAVLLGLASAAIAAAAPVYTAGLTPGRYALVTAKDRAPAGSVCVGDLTSLYRAVHQSSDCRYFPVAQAADRTKVSYECADGSGLLTLHAVTPRAANVAAQGVRRGEPYAVALVARRTGACR